MHIYMCITRTRTHTHKHTHRQRYRQRHRQIIYGTHLCKYIYVARTDTDAYTGTENYTDIWWCTHICKYIYASHTHAHTHKNTYTDSDSSERLALINTSEDMRQARDTSTRVTFNALNSTSSPRILDSLLCCSMDAREEKQNLQMFG